MCEVWANSSHNNTKHYQTEISVCVYCMLIIHFYCLCVYNRDVKVPYDKRDELGAVGG